MGGLSQTIFVRIFVSTSKLRWCDGGEALCDTMSQINFVVAVAVAERGFNIGVALSLQQTSFWFVLDV